MTTKLEKLASAVFNNVNSGLKGFATNESLPRELLEDYVVQERLKIINELSLKGILPTKELLMSINNIPVDCRSLDGGETALPHFQIPQIVPDSISYIGSSDRSVPFTFYVGSSISSSYLYRKRGKNKPLVWINPTPNEKGLLDCYLFNAPMLESVSISAIFADTRLLESLLNCECMEQEGFNSIDNDIVKRLTEKLVRWYGTRINTPNDLHYD